MKSYFASADRTSMQDLTTEINIVSHDPLVSGLLQSISGLLAVLDENRQIVALNDSFLQLLGIDDASQALGLRPGEALQCVYLQEENNGCGTTRYCSSCGAAIAIVSSLRQNQPVERICALSVNRDGTPTDMALRVRSHPIEINQKVFLLLFLQDITELQQRAALERTFFHDINNLLSMLVGASELLIRKEPSALASTVHKVSSRILKEVAIQRCLSQGEQCDYNPASHETTPQQIMDEMRAFFENHPVARTKTIQYRGDLPDATFRTDSSLLLRVLSNMMTNALEATEDHGMVKIWCEQGDGGLSFYVWSAHEIPPDIAKRVFQRNFSTKDQAGRGIGTFSMKLLGEKILGGKVDFTSSKEAGTVFSYTQPVEEVAQ